MLFFLRTNLFTIMQVDSLFVQKHPISHVNLIILIVIHLQNRQKGEFEDKYL